MHKKMKIGELSQATGVKAGTIRFYEKAGFIEPAERLANGYRIFQKRHVYQVRICQKVFGGFINKRLRKISLGILEAARNWDMDAYEKATDVYAQAVEKDITGTERAIATVTDMLQKRRENPLKPAYDKCKEEEDILLYTKKQAAERIGTTAESIRNWERNGLLGKTEVYRRRYYSEESLEKMYIIRLLLDTGYSMMAIKSFFSETEAWNHTEAPDVLINPGERENLIYRADRYLETLMKEKENAKELRQLLQEMQFINRNE